MTNETWIKLTERQPPYGKLVYTRDDKDQIGVYTLHKYPGIGDGWTSRISTDNNAIVEWLEQFHVDELRGICVYCGLIQEYESLEQKDGDEGKQIRIDHIKQCPQRPELKLLAEVERLMALNNTQEELITHLQSQQRVMKEAVEAALLHLQDCGYKTNKQVQEQLIAALTPKGSEQ